MGVAGGGWRSYLSPFTFLLLYLGVFLLPFTYLCLLFLVQCFFFHVLGRTRCSRTCNAFDNKPHCLTLCSSLQRACARCRGVAGCGGRRVAFIPLLSFFFFLPSVTYLVLLFAIPCCFFPVLGRTQSSCSCQACGFDNIPLCNTLCFPYRERSQGEGGVWVWRAAGGVHTPPPFSLSYHDVFLPSHTFFVVLFAIPCYMLLINLDSVFMYLASASVLVLASMDTWTYGRGLCMYAWFMTRVVASLFFFVCDVVPSAPSFATYLDYTPMHMYRGWCGVHMGSFALSLLAPPSPRNILVSHTIFSSWSLAVGVWFLVVLVRWFHVCFLYFWFFVSPSFFATRTSRLAPTGRTLLDGLGHATFNFAAVVAPLSSVFHVCPMVLDLTK